LGVARSTIGLHGRRRASKVKKKKQKELPAI